MRTVELPILHPCTQRLETMARHPQGRFCDECQHAVVNLSALTEAEAKRRVAAARGRRVCFAYRYGPDGTIRFDGRVSAGRVTAAAVATVLAACTPHAEPPNPATPVQGDDDLLAPVFPAAPAPAAQPATARPRAAEPPIAAKAEVDDAAPAGRKKRRRHRKTQSSCGPDDECWILGFGT